MNLKLISLLIVLFVSVNNVSAQSSGKHLEFMGCELSVSMKEFENHLKTKGFVKIAENCFAGKFANRECVVAAESSQNSDCVFSVDVVFDKIYTTWGSLVSGYNEIAYLYHQKYGYATDEIKKFEYPYELNDGYGLYALSSGSCSYFSYWSLDNGQILVGLLSTKSVFVRYEDAINGKLNDQQEKNKALNDI